MIGGPMGRHGDGALDAPTEVMTPRSTRRPWLLPGVVTAVALVLSVVAVVVIVRGSAPTSSAGPIPAPAATPVVGDRGEDPADLPSAPVTSIFPEMACQQTVLTALETDNTAGNRIEAVRISRTYGDSSPQNWAYSDVSTDYYRDAQRYGVGYATQQYREDVLRSCRDEPPYRAATMRRNIDAQYPEIDRWTDDRLLAFRRWVCPIRNEKGKPTASVLVQQRYQVSNSVAYQMMDSSAC